MFPGLVSGYRVYVPLRDLRPRASVYITTPDTALFSSAGPQAPQPRVREAARDLSDQQLEEIFGDVEDPGLQCRSKSRMGMDSTGSARAQLITFSRLPNV